MKTRVKICCIKDISEASMAIRQGAAAIGLVSEMPSGPGVIPEPEIALIARQVNVVDTFLLTSRQDTAGIIEQARRCEVSTVQICDSVEEGRYADIREELPGLQIVQVIHVSDSKSVAEAIEIAPEVDMLLLDSGNPDQSIKTLGGTGQTHNWDLSRKIVKNVEKPVYLAGGLTAENVIAAIQQVRPYGVDICSGVRTAGKLDGNKLDRFFNAVSQVSLQE